MPGYEIASWETVYDASSSCGSDNNLLGSRESENEALGSCETDNGGFSS